MITLKNGKNTHTVVYFKVGNLNGFERKPVLKQHVEIENFSISPNIIKTWLKRKFQPLDLKIKQKLR